MPDPLPPLGGSYTGLRRSVLDDLTGLPVITSAPTGEIRQRSALLPLGRDDSGLLGLAVPQMVFDAIDAVRAPARAYSGNLQVWDPATGHTSDAAAGAATGLAGLAMTGSMPFRAPAGALRSFGGRSGEPESMLARLSSGLEQEAAARPQRDLFGGLLRPAQTSPDPVDPLAALEAALAKHAEAAPPPAPPVREPYVSPHTRAPVEAPSALETRVLRATRDAQGDGFKGDIWDVRPRLDSVPEADFRDALLGIQRKGYATLSQYSDPKAIRGKVGIDIGGDDPRHIVMLRPEGRAAIEGLPVQDLYSGGPAAGLPALSALYTPPERR